MSAPPDPLTLLLAELRDQGGRIELTADGLVLTPPRPSPTAALVLGQLKSRRSDLRARLWAGVEPCRCPTCKAWVWFVVPDSRGFCSESDCPYRR